MKQQIRFLEPQELPKRFHHTFVSSKMKNDCPACKRHVPFSEHVWFSAKDENDNEIILQLSKYKAIQIIEKLNNLSANDELVLKVGNKEYKIKGKI